MKRRKNQKKRGPGMKPDINKAQAAGIPYQWTHMDKLCSCSGIIANVHSGFCCRSPLEMDERFYQGHITLGTLCQMVPKF